MNVKEQIKNLSNDYGENNDCTVRALAVALEGDYAQAHATLKKYGRKKGRGLNIRGWRPGFKDCGFILDDVTDNFDGQTIRTVERQLRDTNDKRMYLLNVTSHVCAWNGKEIVDWAAGRLHRIQNVFHIRPIGEPQIPVRAKIKEVEAESHLYDCTFVMCEPGRSKDGDYRVYIRENGKARWLNTKRWEYDAEEAAYKAGPLKRAIAYCGIVSRPEELPDYPHTDYYMGEW